MQLWMIIWRRFLVKEGFLRHNYKRNLRNNYMKILCPRSLFLWYLQLPNPLQLRWRNALGELGQRRVTSFESTGRHMEFVRGHNSPPKTFRILFGGRTTRSQLSNFFDFGEICLEERRIRCFDIGLNQIRY
nr:hypothetical protein Iba_chr04bCG10580 [Ipomoea batatas]GMC97902.1 hypothetical protein Iba_chr05dCG11470 [Ipomoea batatas]GME11457.1 hypothetical protein Iba_scaffold11641CG0080 [Ipomoea batatas]